MGAKSAELIGFKKLRRSKLCSKSNLLDAHSQTEQSNACDKRTNYGCHNEPVEVSISAWITAVWHIEFSWLRAE